MSSSSRDGKVVTGKFGLMESAPLPLAMWRNIFVVVDDGSLTIEEVERIAHQVLKLGLKHSSGVGGITIIPAKSRPPSEPHRQAIKRAYALVARHLKAMCWTVEGQGFRAATLRAGLAGLRLLLQPSFPTKIADGLEDGIAWLSAQLNSGSGGGVAEGVVEIRGQLASIQETRRSLSPVG